MMFPKRVCMCHHFNVQLKPLKTVRFAQIVEASGSPEPVTLWTEPEQDRNFSKAIRERRVVTVVQSNTGSRADYGLVGFFKKPLASYLVFPRPLRSPDETKVVGIKYEQLAEPKPRGPIHKVERKFAARPATAPPKAEAPKQIPKREESVPIIPPVPKLRRYSATVELVIRQTIPIEVEATSTQGAFDMVKKKMVEVHPISGQGSVMRKASRPKAIS